MTQLATPTYSDDIPTFDGQAIFGDLDSFSVEDLLGSASNVDDFLGLARGTTIYGADPSGGRLWGITGALIGTSSDDCVTQAATIASFAGITSRLGMPTGLKYPGDYLWRGSCYFASSEFVPDGGGPVAIGGGRWRLPYLCVVRELPGGGVWP